MKKILFITCLLITYSVTIVKAQQLGNPKPGRGEQIPFGKKLPPPVLSSHEDTLLQQFNNPGEKMTLSQNNITLLQNNTITGGKIKKKDPDYFRQLFRNTRQMRAQSFQGESRNRISEANKQNNNSPNCNFHLTNDINALAESNPHSYSDFCWSRPYLPNNNAYSPTLPYAVVDNVAYFAADDAVHGNELWRSDGTESGTYLVKDIEPGVSSPGPDNLAGASGPYNITAVNGKIYFSAYTTAEGWGVWVSDGTDAGTQFLTSANNPPGFFAFGNKTCFIADGGDFYSALWQTDGTTAGTKQLFDIAGLGIGFIILQPTVVNGIIFFTIISYNTGNLELWRSDGTETGTFQLGTNYFLVDIPLQLTNYNGKLYFSSDDGTGRRLWVSDGTDAGTMPVPSNQDVFPDVTFINNVWGNSFQPFPLVNNVLFFAGSSSAGNDGLYKYDASNNTGVVLVKDIAATASGASLVPLEMQALKNKLYFKVSVSSGDMHDELWSSQGTEATTRQVYKVSSHESINNLYAANRTLYFVKYDKIFGTELWKFVETPFGSFPIIQSNLFKGPTSSFPCYLTAFKERLMFTAADEKKGNELFMTNKFGFGADIVKDINTTTTSASNAGLNFYNSYYSNYYSGIAALGKDVLFNAYERVHGNELYKSDGTSKGTSLLNDVIPGETNFNIYRILSKNNAVYFTPGPDIQHYAIYKTDGTKNGLREIVNPQYFVQNFAVADNGIVFYVLYNDNTATYELWRTNGTAIGTSLLSTALYNKYYLQVIGNRALFVAGDNDHGYELWRSDGNVSGTQMVKDINPGIGNSSPAGLFIYKNAVYFGGYDGVNHAFWKSDGTESGTVEVKNIDPWSGNDVEQTKRFFCVSKNTLYFSALDYSNSDGTVLYKTDGTTVGTKPIKDINPSDGSVSPGPYYLTDVNGTVFFAANDGVNGTELWKTDGTVEATQLVKNIASYPYISSTPAGPMNGLTSFGGKLYFQNEGNFRYYLWVSDGTEDGTHPVDDPAIANAEIKAIFSTGDKLFVSANIQEYGRELYVLTNCESEKFVPVSMNNNPVISEGTFNPVLYPNPVISNATLRITGNTKDVSISIRDMSGRKLWQSNNNNTMYVNLPTDKFAAGTYLVTVTNGSKSKTIKLVKQ
ncbi:MAG: ELWxxDGT repeat protein [Ginsengibacter sp.]